MGKSFKNTAALFKYIQKQINETLEDDVAKEVKQVEHDAVEKVVYDSYTPNVYDRRRDDGGLSDINNMKNNKVAEGVLIISNETKAHPTKTNASGKVYKSKNKGKKLTPIIVEGGADNYDFPRNRAYIESRDFIQETKDMLEQDGKHWTALKIGLLKRGIKID